MPANELHILRLLWNPDDVEGDIVKPSAFPSGQLEGKPDKYVSVDRSDISDRSVMEATAKGQQGKADGVKIQRHSPMIARFLCGDVRAISVDGRLILDVKAYPIPENPAHCGIENVVGKVGRGIIAELRTKLTKLASPPITLDQTYGTK